MQYVLILVVALGSTGCLSPLPPAKTFQGEEDLSALAVIEAEPHRPYTAFDVNGFDHVMITAVDGKSTEDAVRKYLFPGMEAPEKVMVQPGRRYLSVRWRLNRSWANGKLWLDAEAGKSYVVHKTFLPDGKARFWIAEGPSGKTVGGIDTR